MNKSCLRLGEKNEERCKEVRKCLIGKMSIQMYGVEDRNEWGGDTDFWILCQCKLTDINYYYCNSFNLLSTVSSFTSSLDMVIAVKYELYFMLSEFWSSKQTNKKKPKPLFPCFSFPPPDYTMSLNISNY